MEASGPLCFNGQDMGLHLSRAPTARVGTDVIPASRACRGPKPEVKVQKHACLVAGSGAQALTSGDGGWRGRRDNGAGAQRSERRDYEKKKKKRRDYETQYAFHSRENLGMLLEGRTKPPKTTMKARVGGTGPRSVTTRAGLRVWRGLEGLNKGLGAR